MIRLAFLAVLLAAPALAQDHKRCDRTVEECADAMYGGCRIRAEEFCQAQEAFCRATDPREKEAARKERDRLSNEYVGCHLHSMGY